VAALTKLGLLEQPHTSAGRVPSAKGYRYYLDHLLTDDQPLDRVTRARVDAVFASLDHEPEKLAQGAAKALAAISGCTAAVSTPCAEDLCIAHYEVVQVGRSAAAVLAVTTAGYVRTRVARVRTGLSRENAAALAALLNRNLTFVAPVDLSPRLLAELCSPISPGLGAGGGVSPAAVTVDKIVDDFAPETLAYVRAMPWESQFPGGLPCPLQ